jgi:5-methylcytosine-specific restriction endonuclease McrA
MEVKSRGAAWRKVHPEAGKINSAAWRAANPEKVKASNAARRKAHPEVFRIENARRRARKKGLPATLTTKEWEGIKSAYKHRCAYCEKKETKRHMLTQDHVIPLSKDGGYTKDNIVPACKTCNSKKWANLPTKPVKLVLI